MKSHIQRAHHTPEHINPEPPRFLRKKNPLITQAKINKRKLGHHSNCQQCFISGKKKKAIVTYLRYSRKESTSQEFYIQQTDLGYKGHKTLSTSKDSDNIVSMVFKITLNNQNDYRDFNIRTGSEQYK